MARPSGLGRGLGALIPGDLTTGTASSGFSEIPTASVSPNRFQPRSHFDEQALDSLTASIRAVGLLQPILVRPKPDGTYELIAGERRWRAAKRAGLQTIPALIRETDDNNSLEHALVENLQRDDLNPLEEAAAFQQLIEDFQLTHDQVAQRIGRSRTAITNTLRLLHLPASIQKLLQRKELSMGHARALLGTPDRALQEALAARVAKEGLSVREVEQLVRDAGEGDHVAKPRPTSSNPRPAGLLELEELLADFLETKVAVTLKNKKGRIAIDFADLEDLERVYRKIADR